MRMCTTRARGGPRRTVFVLLLLMVAAGCRTGQQQWGPFRGQVVDAETGKPIAGAHVIVSWQRASLNAVHTTQSFYDAQETVTNANGQFEIPRLRHVVTALVGEPGIGVWAPSYLMQEPEVRPANGRAYVDPTVVKMRPLKTREEECKHQSFGVQADAHGKLPRFVQAQRDYRSALKCWELR